MLRSSSSALPLNSLLFLLLMLKTLKQRMHLFEALLSPLFLLAAHAYEHCSFESL